MQDRYIYIGSAGWERSIDGDEAFMKAIRSGEIAGETLIAPGSDGPWRRADEHPLFQAAQRGEAIAPATVSTPAVSRKVARIRGIQAADAAEALGRTRAAVFCCLAGFLLLIAISMFQIFVTAVDAGKARLTTATLQLPADWLSTEFVTNPALDRFVLWGQWICYGFGCICFFAAMFSARSTLEEMGVAGFRWSKGWTFIAMFIPLLCLYRPWAGLAEIRRAARHCAATGRPDDSWRATSPSAATIGLAVACYLLIGARNGLMRNFEASVSQARGAVVIGLLQDFSMFMTLIQIMFISVVAWYLIGTVSRVRRLFERLTDPEAS